MLLINDPSTYRAIIEDRRRDDGQRRLDIADVEPSAPTERRMTRLGLRRYRSALVPSG